MLRALRKRTSRLGMSLILEGVELPNLFLYEASLMKLSVMKIAQVRRGRGEGRCRTASLLVVCLAFLRLEAFDELDTLLVRLADKSAYWLL